MICPNCGRETTGKFCPGCGTRLTAAPAAPAGSAAPAVPAWPTEPAAPAWPTEPAASAAPAWPTEPAASAAPAWSAGPAAPVGEESAVQLVRKSGSSGTFLLAALFFTLSFLLSAFLNGKHIVRCVENLDQYKQTAQEGQVVGNVVGAFATVVLFLLMTVALWSVFFSARSRDCEPMRTGGLRFFQVIGWVALVGCGLASGFVGTLLVINFTSDGYSSFFRDAVLTLHDVMERSGLKLPFLNVDPKSYRGIFMGLILVILLFAAVYSAKLTSCLYDVRLVLKTGIPIRVSLFVPIITLLGGGYNLYVGIRWLVEGGAVDGILSGVSLLLSAASAVCFALVLLRFRADMRRADETA